MSNGISRVAAPRVAISISVERAACQGAVSVSLQQSSVDSDPPDWFVSSRSWSSDRRYIYIYTYLYHDAPVDMPGLSHP